MRTRNPRRVPTVHQSHNCRGGPWNRCTIYLDKFCDGNTGWLAIGGETGRYARGHWEPMP